MDYVDALSWLYSLSDWERGVGWSGRENPDERWKLGRTRLLLDLAGAPDRRMVCVLVAGTKGKGSTAAMLEAVLRSAGYRTGLYTQPHLHTFRERIAIDGYPVSRDHFATAATRMRGLVDEAQHSHPEAGEPTTFEVTTAMALDLFAQHGVEVAVLEVGLGGRLDATNAVDPVLSVVTSISYDHTEVLGNTLRAIAIEKAGIARPGRVLLSSPQRPAARRALAQSAATVGARLRFAEPLSPAPGEPEPWRTRALLAVADGPQPVSLALVGDHQRENAGTVVAAVGELGRLGLSVSPEAIRRGLESVRWPGRFELVPGPVPVVVDGAHNRASARCLAATLRRYASFRHLYLVLGTFRDKDIGGIVAELAPISYRTIVTSSSSPRAMPPEKIAAVFRRRGFSPLVRVGVDAAVAAALKEATDRDLVCITGSFSVVAEARAALGLAVETDELAAVALLRRPPV